MTTSNPTQQDAPTENSKGELIWKPSVGVYHRPAEDNAQSYGGIVGALQDLIAQSGTIPKSYPYNFAGIIAAIKDLEIAGTDIPVYPGPIPPGSEIDVNGDLIIHVPPTDGQLWFDTRQGRLFVALEEEWYQTNGADGIAFVSETAPTESNVLPGQFWYNPTDGGALFVFDGGWNNTRTGATTGSWVLVGAGDQGVSQTTGTLPLANNGPRAMAGEHVGEILPDVDLNDLNVQSDLNGWFFLSLLELEDAISEVNPVHIGLNPPDGTPKPGQLWYDTESLELSIWYYDGDSGQWVPTAASYKFDEDLATLTAAIETESRVRKQALSNLRVELNSINAADAAEVATLTDSINVLQTAVATKAESSTLTAYASNQYVDAELEDVRALLQTKVANLQAAIPSLTGYVTEAELDDEIQIIENHIAEKVTEMQVHEHVVGMLDAANYTTKTYLDQSLATLSQNYLTHAGGTLTGNLKVNKLDISDAAIDFSDDPASGSPAFKFATQDPTNDAYATFGITQNFWEYAWQFSSHEDFCWIYNNSNKVFSITKEGPACSTLFLGDQISTDINGRLINNKIDLKERLNTYQTAFESIRQGVSDATDFDTLKSNILSALANV